MPRPCGVDGMRCRWDALAFRARHAAPLRCWWDAVVVHSRPRPQPWARLCANALVRARHTAPLRCWWDALSFIRTHGALSFIRIHGALTFIRTHALSRVCACVHVNVRDVIDVPQCRGAARHARALSMGCVVDGMRWCYRSHGTPLHSWRGAGGEAPPATRSRRPCGP